MDIIEFKHFQLPFFGDFSGYFAVVRVLFWEFKRFQLLFMDFSGSFAGIRVLF